MLLPPPEAHTWSRVETALRACPSVAAAIVAERADRPAGRRLLAYLMADGADWPAPAALRELLLGTLPAALVPTTYVTLDTLPMLADGRPDYAALPSPDEPALGMRQYETPFGPVEKALAALWGELLGIEQIGRDAHFFELGGNSTLPVQLVYRLSRDMHVDMPMRALFQEPVLRRYAALVCQAMRPSRLLHPAPSERNILLPLGAPLRRSTPGLAARG